MRPLGLLGIFLAIIFGATFSAAFTLTVVGQPGEIWTVLGGMTIAAIVLFVGFIVGQADTYEMVRREGKK
jgi:hypothetical protein